MRYAVTGLSGFVGRHLAKEARARGITLIDLSRQQLSDSNQALSDMLFGCDAMIHLAARAHRFNRTAQAKNAYERDNVLLTERLLYLTAQASIPKFIFLSTIGVYGKHPDIQPIRLDSKLNPDTIYAQTKLHAEELISDFCKSNEIDYSLLRAPLIYGRHAPGNIGRMQKMIALGLPLPFKNIANKRTLISVKNLCDIIFKICADKATSNRILLPTDPFDLSTPELFRVLAEREGKKLRLFSFPQEWLQRLLKKLRLFDRMSPLWENYVIEKKDSHGR